MVRAILFSVVAIAILGAFFLWPQKQISDLEHTITEKEERRRVSSLENMVEVSAYASGTKPTAVQQRAADALIESTYISAKNNGWFDFETGNEDGFVPMFSDTLHFVNHENTFDDDILNPERPEFLMYYDTELGKKLFGVMYLARTNEEVGPQIGGPLTVWHYHDWRFPLCTLRGLILVGESGEEDNCTEGMPTHRSAEMLHVWFIDHPGGPFSSEMALPQELVEEFAIDPRISP